jgi:hypothetical protein
MAFAREKLPPGFASPNEFQLAVEQETNWTTVICQPHEPERVYYGLYGGEVQAEYDVSGTCDSALYSGCVSVSSAVSLSCTDHG